MKIAIRKIDFFLEHDMDALFIATNATGRSAFNRVEQRMAPPIHELAGLILPHQHSGSHLAANGTTGDPELEQPNFAFAGKMLAEVWSDLLTDGNPAMAEYIDPDLSELNHDDLKQLQFSQEAFNLF